MSEKEIRLIDANSLIKDLMVVKFLNDTIPIDIMIKVLESEEAIDPESLRPKGKWLKHGDGYFDEFCDWVQPVKCSRCGNIEYHNGTYCSDCGALMEDNYES